jgi:ABC-type transport system substrate-binding protein
VTQARPTTKLAGRGWRAVRGLAAIALIATACSPAPTGTPPTLATPTNAAQASPTPALADTIRVALSATIGGVGTALGPLSNGNSTTGGDSGKAGIVNVFIHDALYRYDEHVRPVPSLARSCDPSGDGLTITCLLAEATFQNGDPVTADDVVFTYRVMLANTQVDSRFYNYCSACNLAVIRDCVNVVGGGPPLACPSEVLESVSRVDARTVAFHLQRPFAPFFTLVLPGVWIDSERVVRAAYDDFRAKAGPLDAKDLAGEAGRLADQALAPAGDCTPLLQEAAQMVASTGLLVPDRAEYDYLPNGEFDPCGYAAKLGVELTEASASLGADEITSIAHVYRDLAVDRRPVGAGPYSLKAYGPNKRIELAAFPAYHGGRPATRTIVFQIYPDEVAAAEAVATGQADWVELPHATSFRALRELPTLHTGQGPNDDYRMLRYNVRPGQLFADVRLRLALERCIDKRAAVAAATEGFGVPAYADVPPGTWPYDDQIPKPQADVAAARALIEAAGWTLGGDGIYAKQGKRLAATIYVRHDAQDRVKFTEILGLQARQCGMDLQPSQGDFGGDLRSILSWPNHPPGTDRPFDLYFYAWGAGWDPLSDNFGSTAITTKAQESGDNFGGFSDPRVDDLLARMETTYDLAGRSDLFRQYQEILAEQQPAFFAWFTTRGEATAAGLRTVDGPIDLDLPLWYAFPERLVLELSRGG